MEWTIDNFSAGIHTKPALVEGGEYYAINMDNLIANHDGDLIIRNGIVQVGDGGHDILGIVSTAKYLFVLRRNGRI